MTEAVPRHPSTLRIAITGATGVVGRASTRAALAAGHRVTILGRRPWPGPEATSFQPWILGETPDLAGHDALIHAGFAHVPGRYRGGEGDDPDAFIRSNLDGSIVLFDAAAAAGTRSCLFLSSRAVFDGYPPGTRLTEALPPAPTTLYGRVKVEAERHLATLASPHFAAIALRPTGVYAWPERGIAHKWSALFARFLDGDAIEPAVATEVHADDLAQAVLLLLSDSVAVARDTASQDPAAITPDPNPSIPSPTPRGLQVVHATDLILDRRTLLQHLSRHLPAERILGCHLPPRSSPEGLRLLDCQTLHRLGWHGGGEALLDRTLAAMAQSLS